MKQERSDRLRRKFKREAEKPALYLYSGQRREELHFGLVVTWWLEN